MTLAALCLPHDDDSEKDKGTLPNPIYSTEEYQKKDKEVERRNANITYSPTPIPTPLLTPIPTAVPTLPPITYYNPPEIILDAICNQGLAWNCNEALSVSYCESLWEPTAYNYTPVWLNGENHAIGLFQLIVPFHSELFDGDPYDSYVNARAAYELYEARGNWSHWAWVCRPY